MTTETLSVALKPQPLKFMSVPVNGQRVNVKIEPPLWDALFDIGRREQIDVTDLCNIILERHEQGVTRREQPVVIFDGRQPGRSRWTTPRDLEPSAVALTTAIRVFIMNYFRHLAQGKTLAHDGPSHHTTGTDRDRRPWSKNDKNDT